ncbi:MAG: T9SS type A sorting domain-containing protein [Bacteroidetes bacterium]|nr:T9SS type A sorting domain-containing protein [Bacteroidota bacterium]
MKKISSLLLFLNLFATLQAQHVFYGMTKDGGTYNNGTIFSYDLSNANFSVLYNFNDTNGKYPYGSLVQANNGKLYGMAEQGGISNAGTLFSIDPTNLVFTKLHDFNMFDGWLPSGSLLLASDGKLYGMTKNGGSYTSSCNWGNIFVFDPSNGIFTYLYDLALGWTHKPFGSLMQASDGKLYGMTLKGGIYHIGDIFSYDPITGICSGEFNFLQTSGKDPYGSLIQGNDGYLYGMTQLGGADSLGNIFLFDPLYGTLLNLQNFNGANGKWPRGSLVQNANGILFGMTQNGGVSNNGNIFSYDPNSSTFTNRFDFNGVNGNQPEGTLIMTIDGIFYGMTQLGGTDSLGNIFSYDTNTGVLTDLFDFNGMNGSHPYGDLVELGLTNTSINTLTKENTISIFPNPSNGEFSIEGNFPTDSRIEVFDMIGQKVWDAEIPQGNQAFPIKLNLASAVYSYQIRNSDTILKSGKIIIVK